MNNDHWAKNDMMFICDGNGYVLNKYLQTVCIGPVDNDGNPLRESFTSPPVRAENQREVVSKINNDINHECNDIHVQIDGIFETTKRKRGRPRKDVSISRITKWRRKKEKQLSMAI